MFWAVRRDDLIILLCITGTHNGEVARSVYGREDNALKFLVLTFGALVA